MQDKVHSSVSFSPSLPAVNPTTFLHVPKTIYWLAAASTISPELAGLAALLFSKVIRGIYDRLF